MAKIKQIRCFCTRGDGSWVIVMVIADQAGLFGPSSANDCYHAAMVVTALEPAFGAHLIGRDSGAIEDTWQTLYTSAYWRNGGIVDIAPAGIDRALGDVQGKEAGMPVYQFLGGPCPSTVPCYAYASSPDYAALTDDVRCYLAQFSAVIRCQKGVYDGGVFVPPEKASRPRCSWPGKKFFDDESCLENISKMFAYLRQELDYELKLTHDVHENLLPQNAITLAKFLEPCRLIFLGESLAPEQISGFFQIHEQCTTRQALGELFVSPHEYVPLITERLIDYIRVRVSIVGGITPCRKIAVLCEWFGIQTAWQEGGNNDPINQGTALHLDRASPSFGIQEENHFSAVELSLFTGHALFRDGHLYGNNQPGLGIDIDEQAAEALVKNDILRPSYAVGDSRTDGCIVRP